MSRSVGASSCLSKKELAALIDNADFFEVGVEDLLEPSIDRFKFSAEQLKKMQEQIRKLRAEAVKLRRHALVRCYRRLLVKLEELYHKAQRKETPTREENVNAVSMGARVPTSMDRRCRINAVDQQRRKERKHAHGYLARDVWSLTIEEYKQTGTRWRDCTCAYVYPCYVCGIP